MTDLTAVEYLRLAYGFASKHSDDPATQNGAVLIREGLSKPILGTNRFPPNVVFDTTRLERPAKYQWVEHGERDALFQAMRTGVPTLGTTLYAPWFACADCARAIICAGVKRVVGHKQIFDRTTERWRESIAVGDQMLNEAGVEREYYDGKIGGVRVLFDGQWWEP